MGSLDRDHVVAVAAAAAAAAAADASAVAEHLTMMAVLGQQEAGHGRAAAVAASSPVSLAASLPNRLVSEQSDEHGPMLLSSRLRLQQWCQPYSCWNLI